MKHWRVAAIVVSCMVLMACASGPPRRVSEPAASIQQLTVRADGDWSVDLRLQNYSSLPMRFQSVSLALSVAGEPAGELRVDPAIAIGPESADVVTVQLSPPSPARVVLADALAAGRGVAYALEGRIDAGPEDRTGTRGYRVKRESRLSPVPGLPGVLR